MAESMLLEEKKDSLMMSENVVDEDDEELTEEVYMLTTIDNPFDPFTQFDEWRRFDEDKGYFTCGYLGRIANTALALSDNEYAEEVNSAIDEIVDLDPFGLYIKLKKGMFKMPKAHQTVN